MATIQKLEYRKWSELKGRLVIDIKNAKRAGNLNDCLLDPQTNQIIGLRFKSSWFSPDYNVPVSAVKGIGNDAITLQLDDSLAAEKQSFEKLPTLTQLINNSVVTEGGTYIGTIVDVFLSLEPLMITGYEVSEGGLFAKKHSFELTSEVHYGERMVIIPNKLLDAFTTAS